MPVPVISTAIPGFQNPAAQAGLLPSARSQVNRPEASTAARTEPAASRTAAAVVADSPNIPPPSPADLIPPPEPQQQARFVNDRRDLPLQAQQALQAFERSAAGDNVIASDAIERINIFV